MNRHTRRRALKLLGLTAATPLLVRCTAAQEAAWLAGLQTIEQLFVSVEPELVGEGFNANSPISITVSGVTTTTTVSGIAALVTKLVSALSAASTVTQGQSVLVTVETYINALVPVIWPVVEPFVTAATPGGGFAIGLIIADLPALESMLNFAVNFGKTLLTPQAQQLAILAPANATVLSAP